MIGVSFTAPYSCEWNSTTATEGSHTITARAEDWAGNVSESAPVTVNVSSGTPPDTTPPTVKLLSPAAGADVHGTIDPLAEASDNVAVARVEFLVDGELIETVDLPPYMAVWNTASVADGLHAITARAVDTSGNFAESMHKVLVDNTPPTCSASSPAYSKSTTWTVSYTASDNAGGSGLAEVALYAKGPGQSTYTNVASTSSESASGSFSYTASAGEGSYSFYTIATDKAGNVQATPGTPNATTLLDRRVPTSTASSPAYTKSPAWTVSYSASDNSGGSGLAEVALYAEGPGQSSYTEVGTTSSESGSGSFSFTASAGEGTYSFYTLAKDKAGNAQGVPLRPQAKTLLDEQAPTSSASAPAYAKGTNWTVSYSASDNAGGSGLAEVALYAKGPGQSTYTKAASSTSGIGSGSFNYTASAGEGAYSFYTLATDQAGNTQTAPSQPNATTVLDMVPPSAVAVSTNNASGEIVGVASPGDSVTFTYSETMKPSSILAGWTGAATAVRVQLSRTTGNTSLNVSSANGSTVLPLANPLSLGGIYTTTATAVFAGTMVQTGPSITVTLGPLLSGTVSPLPVGAGSMVWTPRAAATDLAGNACSTTPVSAPGPAF